MRRVNLIAFLPVVLSAMTTWKENSSTQNKSSADDVSLPFSFSPTYSNSSKSVADRDFHHSLSSPSSSLDDSSSSSPDKLSVTPLAIYTRMSSPKYIFPFTSSKSSRSSSALFSSHFEDHHSSSYGRLPSFTSVDTYHHPKRHQTSFFQSDNRAKYQANFSLVFPTKLLRLKPKNITLRSCKNSVKPLKSNFLSQTLQKPAKKALITPRHAPLGAVQHSLSINESSEIPSKSISQKNGTKSSTKLSPPTNVVKEVPTLDVGLITLSENCCSCGMNKVVIKATVCCLGAILLIVCYFIPNGELRRSAADITEKNAVRRIIMLEEDKNADYNYCSNKEVNEYKGWRGHFINSEKNTSEKYFIPVKLKETPYGKAPTIPTTFLIEESDFCTKRPYLKAVVYVHSAIMNTGRRAITRATWGRASDEVGVIFVVGIAKNKKEEQIIAIESSIHRDIVQGNYTDLYQFLVYKNLNAFHWIMKNCNQIEWVVHADDDLLFDVTKFLSFVGSDLKEKYSRKIFCNLMCSGTVVRDSSSKWVVSENEYPYKYFPIYCMGSLWFATRETVRQLLDVAPIVKYLWVDDTFVTGLLAERAEIQRYRIDVPTDFHQNDLGKIYGWRQDGKRIESWNNIVSYYMQN